MKVLALLVLLIVSFQPQSAEAKDKFSFRAKLKQFGYVTDSYGGEYSSLSFLSDNLLLVTINQGVSHGVDPLVTDEPPSTLIVFDLTTKQAVRRASMVVRKSARSVAPLVSGDFLVLSMSDVKMCSPDLHCERSFPTKAVATLDSDSLKLLEQLGRTDLPMLRVDDASTDGVRKVTTELSSTIWNRIMHPISIDEPSPDDFRRISVYDSRDGKTVLSLHYNPKNHLVGPALSPNGSKLAIVRDGALEVYDLP